MKLFIDSSVVNRFYLDHWCSHSCLQESSAQYHPEESPRLPVSYTLLNSDPLSCCHAVSLFWTHLRQMSFLTCLGLSFFATHSKTRHINETIFPIMFVNEVRIQFSMTRTPHTLKDTQIYSCLSHLQTATIDDDSASQMRTLLLIITIVSNFPWLIVGMSILLLLIMVLFYRNRQKKVGIAVESSINPLMNCVQPTDGSPQHR